MSHADLRAEAHPENLPETEAVPDSMRYAKDRLTRLDQERLDALVAKFKREKHEPGDGFRVYWNNGLCVEPIRVLMSNGKRIQVGKKK